MVTTRGADGSDQGMAVSWFRSLRLDPPLVLICIEHSASVHEALTTAPGFAVNILSARQEQIARRFSIVDIERFEGVGFTTSSSGYAILDDIVGLIECRRVALHEGGDHTIIVGEVEATRIEIGTPLLYYRGGYAQLEH